MKGVFGYCVCGCVPQHHLLINPVTQVYTHLCTFMYIDLLL